MKEMDQEVSGGPGRRPDKEIGIEEVRGGDGKRVERKRVSTVLPAPARKEIDRIEGRLGKGVEE